MYDKIGLGKSECALINYHGAEFAQLPLVEAFYISELHSGIWKHVPHHVVQLKITKLRKNYTYSLQTNELLPAFIDGS